MGTSLYEKILLLAVAVALLAPATSEAATKRCERLARDLAQQTKLGKNNGLPKRVSSANSPICFDFTGDGRTDVAFGILSGGTAGPTSFAVFRGVRTESKRLARRYRKVAERKSGSKTLLLRRGRLLVVQNPVYSAEDGNCCPTGGATRAYYRVGREKLKLERTRRLSREEAGQTG